MRPTWSDVIRLGVVGALVAVPLGAAVAAASADVSGWQSIHWNMTEQDVRRSLALLKLDVVAVPGTEIALRTTTRIAAEACEVVFHFADLTDGLDQVRVRVLDTSHAQALRAHVALLRALTDSYGPPTERLFHGTIRLTTRWGFETTTIALRLSTDTGPPEHPTAVSVVYSPTLAALGPEIERGRVGLTILFKMMQEARRP
jgi:hypothetical protein